MYYDNDWKLGDNINKEVISSILIGMYEQQLNAIAGGIIGGELERKQAEIDLKKYDLASEWFAKLMNFLENLKEDLNNLQISNLPAKQRINIIKNQLDDFLS